MNLDVSRTVVSKPGFLGDILNSFNILTRANQNVDYALIINNRYILKISDIPEDYYYDFLDFIVQITQCSSNFNSDISLIPNYRYSKLPIDIRYNYRKKYLLSENDKTYFMMKGNHVLGLTNVINPELVELTAVGNYLPENPKKEDFEYEDDYILLKSIKSTPSWTNINTFLKKPWFGLTQTNLGTSLPPPIYEESPLKILMNQSWPHLTASEEDTMVDIYIRLEPHNDHYLNMEQINGVITNYQFHKPVNPKPGTAIPLQKLEYQIPLTTYVKKNRAKDDMIYLDRDIVKQIHVNKGSNYMYIIGRNTTLEPNSIILHETSLYGDSVEIDPALNIVHNFPYGDTIIIYQPGQFNKENNLFLNGNLIGDLNYTAHIEEIKSDSTLIQAEIGFVKLQYCILNEDKNFNNYILDSFMPISSSLKNLRYDKLINENGPIKVGSKFITAAQLNNRYILNNTQTEIIITTPSSQTLSIIVPPRIIYYPSLIPIGFESIDVTLTSKYIYENNNSILVQLELHKENPINRQYWDLTQPTSLELMTSLKSTNVTSVNSKSSFDTIVMTPIIKYNKEIMVGSEYDIKDYHILTYKVGLLQTIKTKFLFSEFNGHKFNPNIGTWYSYDNKNWSLYFPVVHPGFSITSTGSSNIYLAITIGTVLVVELFNALENLMRTTITRIYDYEGQIFNTNIYDLLSRTGQIYAFDKQTSNQYYTIKTRPIKFEHSNGGLERIIKITGIDANNNIILQLTPGLTYSNNYSIMVKHDITSAYIIENGTWFFVSSSAEIWGPPFISCNVCKGDNFTEIINEDYYNDFHEIEVSCDTCNTKYTCKGLSTTSKLLQLKQYTAVRAVAKDYEWTTGGNPLIPQVKYAKFIETDQNSVVIATNYPLPTTIKANDLNRRTRFITVIYEAYSKVPEMFLNEYGFGSIDEIKITDDNENITLPGVTPVFSSDETVHVNGQNFITLFKKDSATGGDINIKFQTGCDIKYTFMAIGNRAAKAENNYKITLNGSSQNLRVNDFVEFRTEAHKEIAINSQVEITNENEIIFSGHLLLIKPDGMAGSLNALISGALVFPFFSINNFATQLVNVDRINGFFYDPTAKTLILPNTLKQSVANLTNLITIQPGEPMLSPTYKFTFPNIIFSHLCIDDVNYCHVSNFDTLTLALGPTWNSNEKGYNFSKTPGDTALKPFTGNFTFNPLNLKDTLLPLASYYKLVPKPSPIIKSIANGLLLTATNNPYVEADQTIESENFKYEAKLKNVYKDRLYNLLRGPTRLGWISTNNWKLNLQYGIYLNPMFTKKIECPPGFGALTLENNHNYNSSQSVWIFSSNEFKLYIINFNNNILVHKFPVQVRLHSSLEPIYFYNISKNPTVIYYNYNAF